MKIILTLAILVAGNSVFATVYDDLQKTISFCGPEGQSNELNAEDAKLCETYYKTTLMFDIDRKLKKIDELPSNISHWFKVDQERNRLLLIDLYRAKSLLLEMRLRVDGRVELKCKDSGQFDCRLKAYAREINFIRGLSYDALAWKVEKLSKEYSPHNVAPE